MHVGVDVLKIAKVEDKTPTEEEVLIQHTAIGVNHMDTQFRSGKRGLSGTNKIIGYEACGIGQAIGNISYNSIAQKSIFFTIPSLFDYKENRMELAIGAADVLRTLQEGVLKVHIGATYPLDQVGNSHELLESGQSVGSIVLTI